MKVKWLNVFAAIALVAGPLFFGCKTMTTVDNKTSTEVAVEHVGSYVWRGGLSYTIDKPTTYGELFDGFIMSDAVAADAGAALSWNSGEHSLSDVSLLWHHQENWELLVGTKDIIFTTADNNVPSYSSGYSALSMFRGAIREGQDHAGEMKILFGADGDRQEDGEPWVGEIVEAGTVISIQYSGTLYVSVNPDMLNDTWLEERYQLPSTDRKAAGQGDSLEEQLIYIKTHFSLDTELMDAVFASLGSIPKLLTASNQNISADYSGLVATADLPVYAYNENMAHGGLPVFVAQTKTDNAYKATSLDAYGTEGGTVRSNQTADGVAQFSVAVYLNP